jgi:hypothetical protein
MRKLQTLLLTALLASAGLQAQTPDSAQTPAPANAPAQAPASRRLPVLPVPGGGDTLGPDGMGKPLDHPATKAEALKQSKERSDEIAELQARRLAQQLNLNPGQLTRVSALLIQRDDELRKDFSPDAPGAKDHPLTAQERQIKIQQSQEETLAKIGALLTPQQKQVFDAMLAHSRSEKSRRAAIATSRRPIVDAQGSTQPTTPTPASPAAPATQPATASPASAPANPPQSN